MSQTFLNQIKQGAIQNWHNYQILPSITASQASLESGWGKSKLALPPNYNLFGIKASSDWTGATVNMKTQEYGPSGSYMTTATFRVYDSWNHSVSQHGAFFTNTPWRTENYKNVVGETDYKKAAKALQSAGYATDPGYSNKLIKLIEEHKLYEWDKEALEGKPSTAKKVVGGTLTDSAKTATKKADVTLIGDSLGVGTKQYLESVFGSFNADVLGSRQITHATDSLNGTKILTNMKSAGTLKSIVVVILGTNRGVTDAEVDNFMAIAGSNRKVIWVDTNSSVSHKGAVATAYKKASDKHANAYYANWSVFSNNLRSRYYSSDDIHMNSEGYKNHASFIQQAVYESTLKATQTTGTNKTELININDIVYNQDGFVSIAGESAVYNSNANQNWYFKFNGESVHPSTILEIDSDDPQELLEAGLQHLKDNAEPLAQYTINLADIPFELSIGDTGLFIDHNFNPPLYLQGRVLSITTSSTDPSRNQVVIGNTLEVRPADKTDILRIQKELQDTRNNLVNTYRQGKPVILRIDASNGSILKEGLQETTLVATAFKDDEDITGNITRFEWTRDTTGAELDEADETYNAMLKETNITPSLNIKELDVSMQATFTVRAYIDNNLIAQNSTVIKNILDPRYTHIVYADDEAGNGISTNPNGKDYVGISYNKRDSETSLNKDDYVFEPKITKVVEEVDQAIKEAEQAKADAVKAYEDAVAEAKRSADEADALIRTEIEQEIATVETELSTAKQSAIDATNQALADAKAHAIAQDTALKLAIQGEISEVETELSTAKQEAINASNKALTDAKAHAIAQDTALKTSIQSEIDTVGAEVLEAKQEAQNAYTNAVAEAEAKVQAKDTEYKLIFGGYDSTIESIEADSQIAKTKAEQALSDVGISNDLAQTAKDLATTAQSDASTALSNASQAKADAQTAVTQAGQAVASANTAKTNAQTAIDDAQSALTEAGNAKTTADTLSVKVSDLEGEVELKASQTEVDGISGTVSTHTTTLSQQATAIASKADKTVVDTLSGTVSNQGTLISQNATDIASKASSELVNTIKGTVDTHTTEISQNATDIASKASSTSVNALTGRVSTAETTISQHATAIESKASQTEVDTVKGTVSGHTSTLSQHASEISARLTSSQVNSLVDGKGLAQVTYVDNKISATAEGITGELTKVEGKIDGLTLGGTNMVSKLSALDTVSIKPSSKSKWGFDLRNEEKGIDIELITDTQYILSFVGKSASGTQNLQVYSKTGMFPSKTIPITATGVNGEYLFTTTDMDLTAFETAKKADILSFSRMYLNSPMLVSNPSDSVYANSGVPNPPLGGMFNNSLVSESGLRGGTDSPATAWAGINLSILYKETGNVQFLNRAKLVGNYFVNNALDGYFWGTAFKYFPNTYTYEGGQWTPATRFVHMRTFYHVAWSLLEIYDITKDTRYSTLAGQLIDSATMFHRISTGQANSNEIAPWFKGAIFNTINNAGGSDFEPDYLTFANTTGDVLFGLKQRYVALFGNASRTYFDQYDGVNKTYTLEGINTEYMNHLKTMYDNHGLRATYGHKLLYNFSRYEWEDEPHSSGYYTPIAQNWDFIEGGFGRDKWFTGDLEFWAILSFIQNGYTDIGQDLLDQYYTLRSPDPAGRLLFYDRYTESGGPMPDDQSKSTTFTALYMQGRNLLGDFSYDGDALNAIKHYQIKSSNNTIDGGFGWDATDSDALLESKTLGEIVYSYIINKKLAGVRPQMHFKTTSDTLVEITDIQVEEGNKKSDWKPSPKDTVLQDDFSSFKTNFNLRADGWDLSQAFVNNNISKLNTVVSNVDGWTNTISYVDENTTKINQTISQVDSYKQTIGTNGEKIAQLVITDSAVQTQVGNIADGTSKMTQLANSWALTLKSGNDIKTQINASTDAIRLSSKFIHLNGSSLIDNATIKSAMIDTLNASKITGSSADFNTVRAGVLTANAVTSTHINANTALFDKLFSTTSATDRLVAQGAWITDANITSLDAGKIKAGTIETARLLTSEIVTQGLTTDVIKSTHIQSSTLLVDKIFANQAMVDRLWSKTIWANKISTMSLNASQITAGTIDTARLNASAIVTAGLTADVVTSTHIKADTALIDSIFATQALVDRLWAKTIWTNKITAMSLNASQITAGTISSARLNTSDIVTKGLTADVVTSTHIKADTALIDSIFATTALIERLTSKTAFINSIKAISIDVDKITGNTANFFQTAWQGLNSSVIVDSSKVRLTNSAKDFIEMNGIPELRSQDSAGTSAIMGKGRTHYYSGSQARFYIGSNLEGLSQYGIHIAKGQTFGIYRNSDTYGGTPAQYHTVVQGEYWRSITTKYWNDSTSVDVLMRLNGYSINNYPVLQPGDVLLIKEAVPGNSSGVETLWSMGTSSAGETRLYSYPEHVFGYRIEVQDRARFIKQALFEASFVNNSDRRIKHDIKDTEVTALDHLDALTFKEYKLNSNGQTVPLGLIAQDSGILRVKGEDEGDYEGVDGLLMPMLAMKGVQELHAIVKEQAEEIKQLKEMINNGK